MTKTIDALVEGALKRAFVLGQTYWQQADSDFTSRHKKADATRQKFLVVCEETLAALAQARAEQAEPQGDCGNPDCLWRGPISDCSYLGAVGPCCPHCREIVEPDSPPAAPVAKLKPVAWMTNDDEGSPAMLFFDKQEAENFCGEEEQPTPLYAAHNAKLGGA